MSKKLRCPYYIVRIEEDFQRVVNLIGGSGCKDPLHDYPFIVGLEGGRRFQNEGTALIGPYHDKATDTIYEYILTELPK